MELIILVGNQLRQETDTRGNEIESSSITRIALLVTYRAVIQINVSSEYNNNHRGF